MSKLLSRKFLAALVGVISGLAMVFGIDAGAATTVSGAVMAVASVVAYIVTEGKIDAAAVGQAAQQVQDAIDVLSETAKAEDVNITVKAEGENDAD